MLLRCVAGDEALETQKTENDEMKRKVENAQAAMMELTQENQSLQVGRRRASNAPDKSSSVLMIYYRTDTRMTSSFKTFSLSFFQQQ